MSELYYLSEDQIKKLSRYFPSSHGVARVDDHRVVSGIIYVLKRGMQWRDALRECGPRKTLYNRFIRWSKIGVFDKIFLALSQDSSVPKHLQIDATHLKAHRTAVSLNT